MKRYIASDFHNGNKVSDYPRVLSFLGLVDTDADEFLILGDWQELLFANMDAVTKVSPYGDVTKKVLDIASRKPVKVLPGNHDINIANFQSQIAPVEVIKSFSENGVYYTHGYQWDWLSFWTASPVDPVYWHNAFPWVYPWGLAMWLAMRIWGNEQDVYNWGVVLVHEGARKYAAANGYKTVVLGHTHYPLDEVRGGIRIVNVGDQLLNYSYAVEQDGTIELKYF